MTRQAQKAPAPRAVPRPPANLPQPPRTDVAARLGLVGPEGSRRRGALLRRLLAAGDWFALIGALCVATATTSTTDVAVLFWAVMFSPVWILVLKLHGLYDNDHRRIRHSTLDELSSLVSASALGTLALDGLLALGPTGPLSPRSAILVGIVAFLGSFVSRGVLRFLWHRLTGFAAGVVLGAGRGDRRRRPPGRNPSRGAPAPGRLPLAGGRRRGPSPDGLPWLGSVAEISEIAEQHDIERVIVTEQEMSEPAAERLIEECKEVGLGLTFLPQHFGLLGPGIELNRLAELPVLDFRFSDPPRSTLAMKRGVDVVVSALLLVAALAAAAGDRAGDPARLRPPGPLPPAPGRDGRGAVHGPQVPHHGPRRRGTAQRPGRPAQPRPSPPSRSPTTPV